MRIPDYRRSNPEDQMRLPKKIHQSRRKPFKKNMEIHVSHQNGKKIPNWDGGFKTNDTVAKKNIALIV